MPKLLDPLSIGGLSLKNRIVMPPMANDLATTKGEVTQALIAHYTRRVTGVGLVIVEHSYIAKDGKLSSKQLGIYDDALIKGLSNLAESIMQKEHRFAYRSPTQAEGLTARFAAVRLSLRRPYGQASQTKSQENWKSMRLRV